MTICYFSATGNSLYVARRIGGELLSIPQLMRQDEIHIEDDAIGVVCPCYNVEIPMMVRDFIPYFDKQQQIDSLKRKNVEGQIERLLSDIAARKTVNLEITKISP